jgi:hypothetical protein
MLTLLENVLNEQFEELGRGNANCMAFVSGNEAAESGD